MICDFLLTLDENQDDKNTLNPIQEEDQLESRITNLTVNADCDNIKDVKYQFPDTQIKIDLSGPK